MSDPKQFEPLFSAASDVDDRPKIKNLFGTLKNALPELEAMLEECSGDWVYEDYVYRFYHQSFKVYLLQSHTLAIVEKLRSLSPERELNEWFMQIVVEGTGKTLSPEHNECWLQTTRSILEAFFHARYFLEMAVKYGRELEYPPGTMPSGWAALLYLVRSEMKFATARAPSPAREARALPRHYVFA